MKPRVVRSAAGVRFLIGECHEHWPSLSLAISFALEARAKALETLPRRRSGWQATVATLARNGELDPLVYVEGCGICGGDVTVYPYPVHRPDDVARVLHLKICATCAHDRVRRWSDLCGAASAEGRKVRSSGYALGRVLEEEGLVLYDESDRAWELTPSGHRLLARHDATIARAMVDLWQGRTVALARELDHAHDELVGALQVLGRAEAALEAA